MKTYSLMKNKIPEDDSEDETDIDASLFDLVTISYPLHGSVLPQLYFVLIDLDASDFVGINQIGVYLVKFLLITS